MQLPDVNAINARRIERYAERVLALNDGNELDDYAMMISTIMAEHELDRTLAAAFARARMAIAHFYSKTCQPVSAPSAMSSVTR